MASGPRYMLLAALVAVALLASAAAASGSSPLASNGKTGHLHFHSNHRRQPAAPNREMRHSPIKGLLKPLAKSLQCSVCDMILQFVDQELGTNATEQEIVQLLQDVCLIFSEFPSIKKDCDDIVKEYGQTLVFILQEEFAANRVCDELAFCITNMTKPVHVHIAFAGGPDQMSASWFTYGPTSSSVVRWKLSLNGQIIGTATGTASSYLAGGGFTHKTVMTGLQPSTQYYYSVGDEAGGWSPYFSFTTAPAQPQKFSIAVYGDMGVHNSEHTLPRIQTLVDSKRVNWVYHVGDIGYGDDYPGNVYEYVWNSWFRNVQNISSQVAYQVCPGNHEYNCQHPTCVWFSGNFAAYNSRFRMSGAESGSNTNMWYSFDYSYVHFVSISTETDYPQSPYPSKFGNQLQWLENDLKKANASRSPQRPWIIAVGHRPIYSSNAQRNGKADDYAIHIQTAMEDMFHAYGVDVYFSGHVHSYERIYPTYANKKMSDNYVNPPATSYIVAGAAGCIEGLSGFPGNPPDWNAAHYNHDQGYGVLDVGPTTLGWTYYSSADGVQRDSFTLTKTKPVGWNGVKKL